MRISIVSLKDNFINPKQNYQTKPSFKGFGIGSGFDDEDDFSSKGSDSRETPRGYSDEDFESINSGIHCLDDSKEDFEQARKVEEPVNQDSINKVNLGVKKLYKKIRKLISPEDESKLIKALESFAKNDLPYGDIQQGILNAIKEVSHK